MKVMFVGSLQSHIRGVTDFRRFGQEAELSEDLVKLAALGGCAIIPESDPAAQAFTAAELKNFASFGALEFAPDDFKEKKRAALMAYCEFVKSLEEANG